MILNNRSASATLEALNEIVDDACFIIDLQRDKILDANAQCSAMFFKSRQEFIASPDIYHQILCDDSCESIQEFYKRLKSVQKVSTIRHYTSPKENICLELQISVTAVSIEGDDLAVVILRDITRLQKLSRVQEALGKISSSIEHAGNLFDLFREFHEIINELMPAKNFYISLLNSDENILTFPYFVDEFDNPPGPEKIAHGLTEYVLRTGEALLATPEVFDRLVSLGEVSEAGAPCIDWLGIPLKNDRATIGVMTVQSYTEGIRYTLEDLQFLSYVSSHVVNAIHKKQSQEELEIQQAMVSTIFDASPNPILICDLTGIIINCNQAEMDLLGIDQRNKVVGHSAFEFVHPDDQQKLRANLDQFLRGETTIRAQFRIVSENSKNIYVELSASLIYNEDMMADLVIMILMDVTERYEAIEALRVSEERYKLVLEGSNDGIWDWDLQTDLVYYSPRWKRMIGLDEADQTQSINEWFNRVHEDDLPGLRTAIEAYLHGEVEHFEYEHRLRHSDGTFHFMLARGIAVRNGQNCAYRIAGSLSDVTHNKHTEKQLVYEALHDKLTGLPNRALFIDRLNQTIKRLRRHEHETFAILFIDLDRFKILNDSLGHLAGDKMLIKIASRLENALRTEDTVARLGGDEFAILINDLRDPYEIIQITKRIQEEIAKPVNLDGQQVYSTASIGITLSSTGYENSEDMLRDADTAMYQAKGQGGNEYVIFDRFMHAQAVSLLRLESDLRQALDNNQFELYYQPIFDGKEDKVVKAEALIRWNHPRDGLIYPNQFIPLAEDTGLIIPIGEWVFQTACKQLKIWQDMGAHDFQVSVNFSARQFQQSNLAASVARTLEQTRIDPASLIIEITESRNFTQLDRFESILWELKRLGIQISIDDFGTGYSSLTTIQRLPLDILKIGQNFVSNLGAQRENDLIIMSIIEMAHRLGLTVVAEGVETPQQLSFLRTHQCDMIQGFLYSKPIRTPALEEMLKNTYK